MAHPSGLHVHQPWGVVFSWNVNQLKDVYASDLQGGEFQLLIDH